MISGLGIDIIEIDRIEKAVKRNSRFLDKVFTKREIKRFEEKGFSYKSIAGVFAAKEAVTKVLGTGIREFNWQDIEVIHDELGKPLVVLHNNAKIKAIEMGIKDILISISHCNTYAVANSIGIFGGDTFEARSK